MRPRAGPPSTRSAGRRVLEPVRGAARPGGGRSGSVLAEEPDGDDRDVVVGTVGQEPADQLVTQLLERDAVGDELGERRPQQRDAGVQILKLVADGMTNREIAESLFLSRYTVECHVKNIYRKLAVPSRTKAVSEARARGLLS